MREYKVYFKGEMQHCIKVECGVDPIDAWANEQGYDNIEHAAREYLGKVSDFKVRGVYSDLYCDE